jgi:mannose-6-phosphate isomerase-like protein (cupin superfamily)
MNNSYYVGSYHEDGLHGPNRGWIIGSFIKDAPRKNNEVEVKYWEYTAGEDASHGTKVSSTIECAFILKGRTKCLVGEKEVTLKADDYIVIKLGTPNNTVTGILEDVIGITIKAPSDPTAKQIVG